MRLAAFGMFICFGALVAGSAAAEEDQSVFGMWTTHDGVSQINIVDCGDGTPCGEIAESKEVPEVELTFDVNNPDPELRDRPVRGLRILHGFKFKKDSWRRGRIYDPLTGKTYGSSLRLVDQATMKVKGCLGPLCRSFTWRRSEPQG